jgi:hypothetical protein
LKVPDISTWDKVTSIATAVGGVALARGETSGTKRQQLAEAKTLGDGIHILVYWAGTG